MACLQCVYNSMTKNSQVISFRFGEEELEALKAQQQPGESLNQTAQRLLKESLGLSLSTNTVSTPSTFDVDTRITQQLQPIREELVQLRAELGEFAA